MSTTPAIVLGATGYVGGELIRLIAQHPHLELQCAVARDLAGSTLAAHFPHLAPVVGDQCFVNFEHAKDLLQQKTAAVFSALPHAHAAAQIASLTEVNDSLHIVDASADFRFTDAGEFERIYGQAHPSPKLLPEFARGVPELTPHTEHQHASQPGCFATAMQLAIAPALALGWSRGPFFATGTTGATGAGKTPLPTTHTPERHANLFAYKALNHRHEPEVVAQLEAATGHQASVHFVPHAGPFARGIHMTVMSEFQSEASQAELTESLQHFYRNAPFVIVDPASPRLKQVVGSNFARIHTCRKDAALCTTVVIDNLIKGAAGGAVQWMNRLHGWPEEAGLQATALGWH